MSPSRPALLRPAAFGLSAGMILGGLYLAVKARLLSSVDCSPGEDCLLEGQLASELSKFFYLFALGLVLLGLGIGVLVRPRKPA